MPRLAGVSLLAGLLAGLAPALAQGQPADDRSLAQQARAVFKQYCHKCHYGSASGNGDFDVLRRGTLLAKSPTTGQPYITLGKSDQSYVFERLNDGSMPPKAIKERPSDEDKAIIAKWIKANAPDYPEDENRPYVAQEAVFTTIRDDLRKSEEDDRPFLRYFTLTHLYNNHRVPEADLRYYRAALSKAVNSLTWSRDILIPRALDREQTIFALDIRELGWSQGLWQKIVEAYPYFLKYDNSPNKGLKNLFEEIKEKTACELAYVRADWFIVTATRPPLYHTLLELPKTAGELEKLLRVDVGRNFRENGLWRAGLAQSLVSDKNQNRLVERHRAVHGAYWKSYDFRVNNARGTLTQFPLGPVFGRNPFPDLTFTHDGGEIIFNLPNGLQGYLLVNNKDGRLDAAPEDVVADTNKSAGSISIVTGLSCMACHKHGLIGFKDTIREGSKVQGQARDKVQQLYPEPGVMDRLVQKDVKRFLGALDKAVGPFLKVGDDANKSIQDFPDEPIHQIARLYRAGLDVTMVALELDISNPDELRRKDKQLRELGLAPLLQEGGIISRDFWQKVGGFSPMQQLAQRLERGTPVRILQSQAP